MHRWAFGFTTVLLAWVLIVPAALQAQEGDTKLLTAILCELKELRAAVQQAQVAAPLLEANLREREHHWKRRTEVDERLRAVDQEIEAARKDQTKIRNRISTLERSGRDSSDEQQIAELLKHLKRVEMPTASAKLQQAENMRSMLATESSNLAARVADLEHESSRLQRQLQSLAAASSMVCAQQ